MSGIVIVGVDGVDGSETAMRAARTAADLASAMGATLNVVTAYASDKTEVVEIAGEDWTVSDSEQATKVAQRVQGLGRVLGSVANTVAHKAPCDVYIAKTN